MRPLTESALRDLARQQVAAAGSLYALARSWGVAYSLAHRWLAGSTPCPPAIQRALGVEREVRYVTAPGHQTRR